MNWFLIRLSPTIFLFFGFLVLASTVNRPAAAACKVDCDTTTCSVGFASDLKTSVYSVYMNNCIYFYNTMTVNNQTPNGSLANQVKTGTGTAVCDALIKGVPPINPIVSGIAKDCTGGKGDWAPTTSCANECKNKS